MGRTLSQVGGASRGLEDRQYQSLFKRYVCNRSPHHEVQTTRHRQRNWPAWIYLHEQTYLRRTCRMMS